MAESKLTEIIVPKGEGTRIEEQTSSEPPTKIDTVVGDVTAEVKLNLYVDKLEAQTPEIERICEDSVVREKTIPLKRAVLEHIVSYALTQPFDLESMKVHKVVYDKSKNLVVYEIKVANTDEMQGNTLITYVVEGRHGPDQTGCTNIEWVWTSGVDFDNSEAGGRVANYKDGKWILAY